MFTFAETMEKNTDDDNKGENTNLLQPENVISILHTRKLKIALESNA